MMDRWPGVVDFDHQDSWPVPILELLRTSRDALSAYKASERDYFKRYFANHTATVIEHSNEFKPARDAIIGEVAALLMRERILCFHGTRLLPDDIEDVRQQGLRLPSPDFLARRIGRAVERGYLDRVTGDLLLKNNQAAENYRRHIHFGNRRADLRSGLIRLLVSWGGEACYVGHEYRSDTGPALRRIGEPCLVVATVPVSLFPTTVVSNAATAFVDSFNQGSNDDLQAGFESWVTQPIPATWILDLIQFQDPRFELLTEYSKLAPDEIKRFERPETEPTESKLTAISDENILKAIDDLTPKEPDDRSS